MPEPLEKVLIFTGPSLDHESIREVLPDAIIRPPARQGDIISDCMEYEPNYVLLIEGTFHQSLSVWHKELCWALQIPGVRGVYGASSMGALRAADLADYGMIGSGKIFEWYWEGIISDESEVSALYTEGPNQTFKSHTVPLVDVRAALLKSLLDGLIEQEQAEEIFAQARSIHWTERTLKSLKSLSLAEILQTHSQKRIDALQLLHVFRDLKPIENFIKLDEESLSLLFSSAFERDRAVVVNSRPVKLQDLESYVLLHDEEAEEHVAEADYRALTLLLADVYRVGCTTEELDAEWQHFNVKMGLRSLQEHNRWLRANHVNGRELVRLMTEQVRLKKMRKALMVRSGPRRRTQRFLDFLKLSKRYQYWASAAARHEELISAKGGEETLVFGDNDVSRLLSENAKRNGVPVTLPLSDYVAEMGWGSVRELMVGLARDKLADQ